jgi:crotonobetainyl-CoA:carnitine CoA-transferase CaiB-like acyl-CoA transferase
VTSASGSASESSAAQRQRVWPLSPLNVDTGLPLDGVRVLDLSRVLAGPLCAMIAGDLGADVIKVESPDGDPVRALAPPRFGDDATYFLAVNRHRRNVVADLRRPEHRRIIEELLSVADGVVENFLPSQRAVLGLDAWRQQFPDLVWVSVTSASSTGPIAQQPTFDLLAQARSGIMSVTGTAQGEPTKVGAPVADVITGLYATIGLLSGLFARATNRSGRHFEAPLLESMMSALINQAQSTLVSGEAPQRLGNDHPSITPYGPVRTSDGLLLIAVGTDTQFAKLVEAVADAELTSRSDFSTNDVRVARRSELRGLLDRIFSAQTTNEWLTQLSGCGVPMAPILDVAQALTQEQILSGDFVVATDAPAGPINVLASPLRIDGRRPAVRSGPRRLGQDNESFGL